MCKTEKRYKACINEAFVLNDKLLKHAQEIVMNLKIKSRVGRPPIDFATGLNGVLLSAKNRDSMEGATALLLITLSREVAIQ